MASILKVDDINVYYGSIHAIKGISFEVNEGEIMPDGEGAGRDPYCGKFCGNLPKFCKQIVMIS